MKTIVRLADLGIAGVKDATFDMAKFSAYQRDLARRASTSCSAPNRSGSRRPGRSTTGSPPPSSVEHPPKATAPAPAHRAPGCRHRRPPPPPRHPACRPRPPPRSCASATVRTDVFELTFDSEGGSLVGARLLKHAAETGKALQKTFTPLELLTTEGTHLRRPDRADRARRPAGTQNPHAAGRAGRHRAHRLADGQDRLVLRFESEPQGGVVLSKTYTLRRHSYLIDVQHEVRNASAAPRSGTGVPATRARWPQGRQRNALLLHLHRPGGLQRSRQKYQRSSLPSIDKGKIDIQRQAPDGYVAMVQHYFTSAWLMPAGVERENFVRKVDNLYAVGQIGPDVTVAPGATQTMASQLYVGPQEEKVLEAVAPGLESSRTTAG